MSAEPATPAAPTADQDWTEIQELIDEIGRLASSAVTVKQFYATLVERAVGGLAAAGGAAWLVDAQGRPVLQCQTNRAGDLADTGGLALREHLVADVLQSKQARLVPPQSGLAGRGPTVNPTGYLLILAPVVVEREPVAVLEIVQRPQMDPAVQRGYLRLLSELCDLAGEFHRNHAIGDLRSREALWSRLEQFIERVHGSLDLKATAYEIAHEGRRFIGCDRVSVLVRRGATCRLMAVSGSDSIDRRSNLVRRLEQLVEAVVSGLAPPLWYPGSHDDLPPQIASARDAFLDQSHARALGVVPLGESRLAYAGGPAARAIGAIVVEGFDAGAPDDLPARVAAVGRHATTALRNAQHYESLPLLRAAERLRWLAQARRLPKSAGAALAAAIAAVALAMVPAEFTVEGRGAVQPQRQHDLFAPCDGVVSQVHVRHADSVAPGQVLVTLRSPQLELELSRVAGEIQTARKRLAAVEASRLGGRLPGGDTRGRSNQLTGEEEELRELLASLDQQQQILQARQSQLQVRSPIQGQVQTWNVDQLLEARPVARGQALLTVADLAGAWVLEIRLADDRIEHVLRATREFNSELRVSFILAGDPGATHRGRVEKVASQIETSETEDATVLVTATIDRRELPHVRPGTTAIAKVHCGRRSIGYIWLHEMVRAVQTWFW